MLNTGMVSSNCMSSRLSRYIGHTVTIYTDSGGESGGGFTGVLLGIECGCIRLLTCIGAAPACPLTHRRCGRSTGGGGHWENPFGSSVVIPLRAVASFVHNSIH